MRQLILDLQPAPPPTLENFVIGDNQELRTRLSAWIVAASPEFSLFVWGEAGVGKTHLLRAVSKVYIDAHQSPEALLQSADHVAPCIVAVDHVERLDAAGQQALFTLFNRLRDAGGKLLVAAASAPQHLAVREDLRTRLGSALIYRVWPLSDADKRHALLKEAQARQLPLSADMLDYLLLRAPRDMASLMNLLAALDRFSLETKRTITLPLLREILHTP